MWNKTKKIFISIVLGVYLLTNFFQSVLYRSNTVYAAWISEDMLDYTNIVAIIVNDQIYDRIKSDIEWYATTYIQWKDSNHAYTAISNSKALVFPINVDNFSAKNITQLLENIYFDWITGEPSRLVWIILIWDVPLPVVNQNWYIYPTIYPYVDFEEQKFIWDEETKYFVYNGNSKWQAEVWHWMINFGNDINEYTNYFTKLKQYWRNPTSYIWKAIWYDDFIWNSKYFNEDSLNFYLNNFIFAEDIWYHRYNDLMVKVLQWQRNNEIAEIMDQLNEAALDLWSSWFDNIDMSTITDDMNTPTLQIKAVLDNGYLIWYSSLFWQKYLKTITNNIETANRWLETRSGSDEGTYYLNALDSVYKQAEMLDETLLRKEWQLEPFLIMVNNALEEAVDKKVEQEKYWLKEVIPLTYLEFKWKKRFLWKCVWEVYSAYENYFFGQKAVNIQSMEETSTYRWTYRNYVWIDGLTIQDIQESENPATDIPDLDLNKKSVWWSYEIFATQVDANRWYNYNNSLEEYDVYSWHKTAIMDNWDVNCVKRILWICVKRRWAISDHNWSWCDLSENWDQWGCENPMEYAIRIWWWASPLNLTSDWWYSVTWKSWYSYSWATSSIFDIGWSTSLLYDLQGNNAEYESNSFSGADKYANLILRRFSPETRWPKFKSGNPLKKEPDAYWFWYDYSMDYETKFTNWVPEFDGNRVSGWTRTWTLVASDVDYFTKYYLNPEREKQGNIIKLATRNPGECQWNGTIYTYKTLDSRVKNDSVNKLELNGEVYSIFDDTRSPSRQFYDELYWFLSAVSGSVDIIVWTWNDTLVGLLSGISAGIDRANIWFSLIRNADVNSITNLETWAISDLAENWLNAFNDNVASTLLENIKAAQEEVLTLSWFIDVGDSLFDGVSAFIDEEYKTFEVNGWDVIFLDSWKENLFTIIEDTLNKYHWLQWIIQTAHDKYDNINLLWLDRDVIWDLSSKKNALASQQWWSWCEQRYRELCEALDKLMHNYERYADDINNEKNGINNIVVPLFDDDGEPTWETYVIENIFDKLFYAAIFDKVSSISSAISDILVNVWAWVALSILLPWIWWRIAPFLMWNDDIDPLDAMYQSISSIPSTWNALLTWVIPWLNMTTSDRPIDSPRYLTFKWIGWDKVTFIYPDIYKAEIFSGNTADWVLKLKTTGEIAEAIKDYLRDVVKQYNSYLREEAMKHEAYYNANKDAYDKLAIGYPEDPLASPKYLGDSNRPYWMFSNDYLIEWLEDSIRNSDFFSGSETATSDPIWFIADMIYYQNITWKTKTISDTIQWDIDNQRTDFDINEKISYILDNYLVSNNNRWNILTPYYRDNWYEVAYINSNWNDYISYEVTPPLMTAMSNFSSNYSKPATPDEDRSLFEQELISECNIPEEGWVLIFQLSGSRIETPWFDALKCRWEKTREKPLEFKITFPFTWDEGSWFWENLWNVFNISDYEDIWNFYVNQLKLLNTNDVNDWILDSMYEMSPSDAEKLQKILSYTIIKAKKSSISADEAIGEINISSSVDLWNVDFYITNVWESKLTLLDSEDNILSNNITIATGWFNTWHITFNPYDPKKLKVEIINPKEWLNVVEFYMCLPWTQDMSHCMINTLRLDVVPWAIKNISLKMENDIVLEWASVSFTVEWTDNYWNNVWELVAQKFEASSSSGTLSLYGTTANSIKFSNFNKSKFSLNAIWWNLDKKIIKVQVSWNIDWVSWVKASGDVLVKKWRIDVYSWSTKLSSGPQILHWLNIKLPDENIYVNTDQYWLNQYQTWKLPKIELRLIDTDGHLIDIDWRVTIKSKNNRLNPWWITIKTINKNINWESSELTQYNFGKSNYFYLSGWICTIYLLPNFSAWDDVLFISMPWIDDIQIPVHISTASPKIVSLTTENKVIDINSSIAANLKIFDNWNNLINSDIQVDLNNINDKISLSSSGTITVHSWSFDFTILSHDKWWVWYIYSTIKTNIVPINEQSPGTLTVTIQEKMLPERNLNIMYLNLFGSDWWNQWWYMSKNEKYAESLIKNSDKLLAVTTQLVALENIKYFPIIIDDRVQINNLWWKDVKLSLNNGFVFDIDGIGSIAVKSNSFKLEAANISEENLETYIKQRMSGQNKWKNILFYIPEQTDSIIESNYVKNSAIYLNDEKVFDISNYTFDNNLSIELYDEYIAWYQVRQIYFEDNTVWKLLMAVDNENAIQINLASNSATYWVANTWINWTSNKYGHWFYEIKSQLSNSSFWYTSIQDSHQSMLWIWFTSDFKNITNFWWWMSVWEATVPFSSELLINIWDPLLKRVDSNESAKIYDLNGDVEQDTEFDLWLWEIIYSEPGKQIFKVINIDFNNDNLEDIIVIFKDWTIKILKNYWGTEPFQDLWPLSIIADRISDVSVWDVDWNWYKDLIIWTEVWWMRVYLNNWWIFDVDWYPVCININVDKWEVSEHPEKVSWLHQIFLEDMDVDGSLDIVTNDSLWFIKIFYGGTTNGNVNYLSTNKYMCDENRYERSVWTWNQKNSQIVYQFGIKLDATSHILDQSLIRWEWISSEWSDDLSNQNFWIDTNFDASNITLDNIWILLDNVTNFDISAAEDVYQQFNRLKQAWFGIIPTYEQWVDNEWDINYIEIWCLTWQDPVKVYKTYEDLNHNTIDSDEVDSTWSLVNGDLVRVTVHIIANDDFTWTFIDNIVWPWIIPLSEYNNETFENFWFNSGDISSGHITAAQIDDITSNIHWDLENAKYMVDNIHMRRWNSLQFSYWLIYNNDPVMDIDVNKLTGSDFSDLVVSWDTLAWYLNNDKYPDISVQPGDWCNDSMFIFFNDWTRYHTPREYTQKYVDLAKLVHDYEEQSQENWNGEINNFYDNIWDSASEWDAQSMWDQISSLAGWLWETINWKDMLSSDWIDFTNIANIWTQFVDAFVDNVMGDLVNKIDKAIWSACNWISLSSLWIGGQGWCGLPVPFNQALLWVWKYHAFGCFEITPLTELIWDGMPVLNIPGNRTSPYWYIPAPGFFGYPFKWGGDNFSFWNDWWSYPSMFRVYLMPTLTMNLWIALCFGPYGVWQALKDPRGSLGWNCVVFAIKPRCPGLNSNDEWLNSSLYMPPEYSFLRWCTKQNNPCYIWNNESSTPFVLWWSASNTNSFYWVIPEWSYAWWLINLEYTPETALYTESSNFDIDAIILEWGAQAKNKILWSTEQWLIEKVVKKWLDKQIKYIMSNLTNFKLSVTWPDFDAMIWDMPSKQEFLDSLTLEDEEREICEKNKGIWLVWTEDPEETESKCGKNVPYCCVDTNASLKIKCENRWLKWDDSQHECKANEASTLWTLDAWMQENGISKAQMNTISNSIYANPFKQLSEIFKETPLVNISTQNIVINVPMISSEDITAYISMSQSRVDRQQEIIDEWKEFFSALIGFCWWSTNINGIDDLQEAVDELKERYKDVSDYSQTEEDDQIVANLQAKINALEKLKSNYNLSDLWDYKIYEEGNWWFYVYTKYTYWVDSIVPFDVYLLYNPGNDNLSMFTSWFDLIIDGRKILIQRNSQEFSNKWLNIKKDPEGIYHSCAEIFADWTIDSMLKWFINIQSSADRLIRNVKENIETLEQYKQFPMQIYEWIHVLDKYIWEIANLLNSTVWTLSMWMETNARRVSQYIDAMTTIMTTLETYQLIIDLSADWSEKCSTCTRDNYDQFTCKLGMICDAVDLPILQIPPMKIPSLYLDFSEMHIETDVKLPNFKFNPVSVNLPKLPDLPTPPDIDLSIKLDELIALWLNSIVKGLLNELKKLKIVDEAWLNIPLLPSPPVLPELPSFIPEIEMELPLLPPAPKIPKLPDKIQAAIKAAKLIGRILCIVKLKFWLVAEGSIKAKVEQITQRDYEVFYVDNFDQTLADWNNALSVNMWSAFGSIFSWFTALLQSNEFKNVKLKWFDFSLQTYVNLQYNFDDFYRFLNQVVWEVNSVSYKISNAMQDASDYITEGIQDSEFYKKLKACSYDPISVECLWPWFEELIQKYNDFMAKVKRYQELMETSFDGIEEIMATIENKQNEIDYLSWLNATLYEEIWEIDEKINWYNSELTTTTDATRRDYLLREIEARQREKQGKQQMINENNRKIEELQQEIDRLNDEYWSLIDSYNEIVSVYNEATEELNAAREFLLGKWQEIMDQINAEMEDAGLSVNFENMNNLEENIKANNEKIEQKKALDRQMRMENLQNLYKDVDWPIAYVDFDYDINKNNFQILQNTLSEINNQTNNKDIQNRAQEYLSLLTSNRNIDANLESLGDIENSYTNIINQYLTYSENLSNLINSDYDKFLESIADNDTSLVKNDETDIILSAKLFDMDNNVLQILSNQDSIMKKYLDYNVSNIDWYINALNNHSAQDLNMSENTYNIDKEYLNSIKSLSDKVYDIIDNNWKDIEDSSIYKKSSSEERLLLAQSNWWWYGWWNGVSNNGWSSSNNNIDIANYIEWQIISTNEWIFLLSNTDYVKKFQSRYILTDINWTGGSDLILWDDHNVYIKYRWGNNSFNNTNYDSKFYTYRINSYEELWSNSEDWFVKIARNLRVKLIDTNREVKEFKQNGQNFDTITVSWLNNGVLWDSVDWYLVKMIHRVDQFNDHENLNSRWINNKKYILVLPKWSELTWMKLQTDETILENIEEKIWTWNEIFGVSYFNKSSDKISLTVTDLPRNWQYSEIYTLNLINNTYIISSSSSNQIVAWPQVIADSRWPDPTITLYRPAINTGVSEWTNLQWFVWTNYILQVNREDNVAMDEIWIADAMWNTLNRETDINQKTWYIELSGLYFTWEQNLSFYVWWTDIDWNQYISDVMLLIKTPDIEITNIFRGNWNGGNNLLFDPLSQNMPGSNQNDTESFVTIVAELENDIDSWYVQFLRNRINDKWEILTWKIWWNFISQFQVAPENTEIYWRYFDIGDDIWLYSQSGDMVAKINPENWKITITPGFENIITIKLDYSPKIPVVKVMEWNKTLFWVIFSSTELVNLDLYSNWLSIEPLEDEWFGDFYWWQAVLRDWQVILYLSPLWQVYTDMSLYWEYWFDNLTNSVTYTFKTSPSWSNLWKVKIKIKNLLDY